MSIKINIIFSTAMYGNQRLATTPTHPHETMSHQQWPSTKRSFRHIDDDTHPVQRYHMKTMQACWPGKPYVQKCGAGYFVQNNEINAALRERQRGFVSRDHASVMLPFSSESSNEGDVVHDSEEQEGADNEMEQEKTQEAEVDPSEAKTTVPEPLAVQPTEDDITAMLRSLRDSRNAGEAEASIKALVRSTDSRVIKSVKVRKSVTTKIVRQGGVFAIIVALEKWHEKSEGFAYHALTLLVSISKFVAKSRKSIATIGCKTVLDTAKMYQDDYFMRGNILALLQNLSNEKDKSTKQEVAADEYIDCVVETMKKWPDDSYIQSCGCDYFARIGKMEGMTAQLRAKRIGSLMGEVLDNFHEVDANVYSRARNVMEMIHVG
jgi:hypothetical protein